MCFEWILTIIIYFLDLLGMIDLDNPPPPPPPPPPPKRRVRWRKEMEFLHQRGRKRLLKSLTSSELTKRLENEEERDEVEEEILKRKYSHSPWEDISDGDLLDLYNRMQSIRE